jgi:hypothetical protein
VEVAENEAGTENVAIDPEEQLAGVGAAGNVGSAENKPPTHTKTCTNGGVLGLSSPLTRPCTPVNEFPDAAVSV